VSEPVTAEVIVLRLTPYRESALVAAGLSPEYGRVDMIAHGARKSDGKAFPVLDLYRHLAVTFVPPRQGGELAAVKELELVNAFPDLARRMENLEFMAKVGRFLLRNTVPDSPQPMTFDALRNLLEALSGTGGGWSPRQCAILIKLTFLYENGVLPEPSGMADADAVKMSALYEKLIECAISGDAFPRLSEDYCAQFDQYLNSLISSAQLHWS